MVDKVEVVYHVKDVSLKEPYLICGFPGSGFVGKLAVDHLIQELNAKLLADIYSTAFPPQVMIRQDGTLDLMKVSMYYWHEHDKSLLLLTGDTQPILPDAEYELADTIIEVASRFDCKVVYTLAAYITGVFVNKPKVYATATDKVLLDDLRSRKLEVMESGSVTGMNGILLGVAKLRGLKGICLLGETSGYMVDASASQVVLKALLDILKIKVDMQDLEKKAKEAEPIIKALEQQLQQQEPQQKPSKDLGYIS